MLDLDYLNWTNIPTILDLLMLGSKTEILDSTINLLSMLPLCLRESCSAPSDYILSSEKYGAIRFLKVRDNGSVGLNIYLNSNPNTTNIICIQTQ